MKRQPAPPPLRSFTPFSIPPYSAVADFFEFIELLKETFATVTFRRRHKALDLLYDVQFSGNLTAWTTTTEQVRAAVDPGGGMESVTFATPRPSPAAGGLPG